MSCQSSQINIANPLPAVESARFFANRLKQLDTSLLIETTFVTTAAISAIKLFEGGYFSRVAWLAAPVILVAAALVPAVIRRQKSADIGLNISRMRSSLMVLGLTCAVIFPALFAGLWLLKSFGLELPLRPVLPPAQSMAWWLFYQFMYVAVAEEVFFRGYVQSNVLRLTNTVIGGRCRLQQWTSIVISAAIFAVAHIVVQGQITSALTFLPGLVLGWLFLRTRSLLAPILFHGLANTCYFVMAAAFA